MVRKQERKIDGGKTSPDILKARTVKIHNLSIRQATLELIWITVH